MNFSTNQVMQLFVLANGETAEVVKIYTPDKSAVRGYIVKIKKGNEVIDTTDIIDAKNILSVTEALASSANEQLKRKGLLVKLNSKVNSGAPAAGEEYIMTLVFRGYGDEDTIFKKAYARAGKGDTAASLLQKLATNLLENKDVEYSPLYELRTTAGAEITKANIASITADGFYIVEPVPYWSLARFSETLMNIDVQTAPIVVDSNEENQWLDTYKFAPVSLGTVPVIPNTHKVADLEYFCKGERGTSNALVGWPDTPDYVAKVNPNSTKGYDILTVHCAFVGANASNQKSEKDLVFITEGGASTLAEQLAGIKTGIADTSVGE